MSKINTGRVKPKPRSGSGCKHQVLLCNLHPERKVFALGHATLGPYFKAWRNSSQLDIT